MLVACLTYQSKIVMMLMILIFYIWLQIVNPPPRDILEKVIAPGNLSGRVKVDTSTLVRVNASGKVDTARAAAKVSSLLLHYSQA